MLASQHPLMGLVGKYVSRQMHRPRADESDSSASRSDSEMVDEADLAEEEAEEQQEQLPVSADGEPFTLAEFMVEFGKDVQKFNAAYQQSKK